MVRGKNKKFKSVLFFEMPPQVLLIKPGQTGLAQISGRDELEIPVKAKLDGDYAEKLRQGGLQAFLFDCRCFIGTVFSVARGDGVVEGGTGEMKKQEKNQ